jgi:tetraacyldisaccharide 4'-kinase
MNQYRWRQIVSGHSRGTGASLLRGLLTCAAAPYAAATAARNGLYSSGLLKTFAAKVPVISVGNITAGGTGKTPLVIWICNLLKDRCRVAILTRGYKAQKRHEKGTDTFFPAEKGASPPNRQSSIVNRQSLDEPSLLMEACPGAGVIVNPDRAAAAEEAVERFGAEAIILDDGFQHRRIARDVDVVTIDATCPFGYGKLLPAGLLREPVRALRRATAVVLTRTDQVEPARLGEIEQTVLSINGKLAVARSVHSPARVRRHGQPPKEMPCSELEGRAVFAFCGIGNPEAFLKTVENLGAKTTGSMFYDDHHEYAPGDLADIRRKAESTKAEFVLTTEKDWTRISPGSGRHFEDFPESMPLACLDVRLEFTAGEDALRGLIEKALRGRITDRQLLNGPPKCTESF